MATGNKPDYELCVINKKTEARGKVGAGWKNPDGSVSIKLNVCVTLRESDGLALTLFPPRDWSAKPATPKPFAKPLGKIPFADDTLDSDDVPM